jgi:hypothetical protein
MRCNFIFGVCDEVDIPDTLGCERHPETPPTAAAYQVGVWNKSNASLWATECNSLGDISRPAFRLIDPSYPITGVEIIWNGGSAIGCPYGQRSFSIAFVCIPDYVEVGHQLEVSENIKCQFRLEIKTAYGCPAQCKRGQNGLLCSGTGTCGYVPMEGAACICDFAFFGLDCSMHNDSVCVAGTAWDANDQRCRPCERNTYQGKAGQKSCVPCPGSHFQPLPGKPSCIKCPKKGISCEAGYPRQLENWWRAADSIISDTKLYACYQEGACIGSEEQEECNGANGENCLPPLRKQCKCDEKNVNIPDAVKVCYTGPVCALCESGTSDDGAPWRYTRQGGECRRCAGSGERADVTGIVLLVLFVFFLVVNLYRKRRATWLVPIVKIVLTFVEMISLLEESFAVPWPKNYRSLMSSVRVALASLAELSALACAVHVDRYVQLLIWTFGMLVVWALIWARYRWLAKRGDGAARQEALKRLFYVSFFCYPLVAPIVTSIFQCRDVAWCDRGEKSCDPSAHNVSFLKADYTLRCDDSYPEGAPWPPPWAAMAAWSGLWTVFFIVGFPALTAVTLRRRYPSAAFLTEHYHDHGPRRYWEVVDMLKKVLLTSFLLVFDEGTRARIAMAVLIAGVFLLLHVRYQPYHSVLHNRLETVALAALTLTYFIGLLIKAESTELSTIEGAFDVILIALVASVVLATVLLVYIALKAGHETLEHVKHDHNDGEHTIEMNCGGGGRLVRNVRGLRLTMASSRSSSGDLGESLLGSVGGGDEGEEDGAEAELAHERLRASQLEAELARARGEKEQKQAELEKREEAHAAALEKVRSAAQLELQAEQAERARCSAEAVQAKAELAQLKAKTE